MSNGSNNRGLTWHPNPKTNHRAGHNTNRSRNDVDGIILAPPSNATTGRCHTRLNPVAIGHNARFHRMTTADRQWVPTVARVTFLDAAFCVPSQKGLFWLPPQRHSRAVSTRATTRPVPLMISRFPFTWTCKKIGRAGDCGDADHGWNRSSIGRRHERLMTTLPRRLTAELSAREVTGTARQSAVQTIQWHRPIMRPQPGWN